MRVLRLEELAHVSGGDGDIYSDFGDFGDPGGQGGYDSPSFDGFVGLVAIDSYGTTVTQNADGSLTVTAHANPADKAEQAFQGFENEFISSSIIDFFVPRVVEGAVLGGGVPSLLSILEIPVGVAAAPATAAIALNAAVYAFAKNYDMAQANKLQSSIYASRFGVYNPYDR